jgi:rhamnose utilization protein RhaD (predicted bifunctional aldolase and dehydrogenase)/NAD(P)-dependent dehydrogenase (short-subunit alcohol dehydrogenase family)
MESRYRAAEVERYKETYAPALGLDLALRIYSARLLGEDPELVFQRGGSASVKAREIDLYGQDVDVLHVSGDDEDLATIQPKGFAACDLVSLRRLADRAGTSDEEMLSELARRTLWPGAPPPSTYAPVHAILPGKYVDHAQADAILAVINQPGGADIVREIFGDRALFVPYAPPGMALARRVLEASRARPGSGSTTGSGARISIVVADRNGIFTWGETAEGCYEQMIAAVTRVERYIADTRLPGSRPTISAADPELYARLAPIARGELERASGRPWILAWKTTPQMRAFCDRMDMTLLAQLGCAAPDHATVMRPRPLVLREVDATVASIARKRVHDGISDYAAAYEEYVRRASGSRRAAQGQGAPDAVPRVILFEGLGALAAAADGASAERAANLCERTAAIIDAAYSMQGYQPASDSDFYDAEHGAVGRARIERAEAAAVRPLDRRIALVTGGAAGVGLAAARALLRAGAHVVLADRSQAALEEVAQELEGDHPKRVAHIACDVSVEAQARRAASHASSSFGGLDILVSSAPPACSTSSIPIISGVGGAPAPELGALHTTAGSSAFRSALEQTLMGHQNAARAAVEVMLLQGTGGSLLFLMSKGAWSSGPEAGPCSVAEAGLLALMRQYAIDVGAHHIRSNAVSHDRDRARASLLAREATADDVAAAIVFLATAEATTGCVLTVDGGSAAPCVR